MSTLVAKLFQNTLSRKLYRVVLFILTIFLVLGSLLFPIAIRQDSLPLKIGSVSPSDIVAPHSISYESEYLTQIAQDEAARSILPKYLPSDPTITRTQIDNLHIALNYISSVRADSFAEETQKIEDISNLSQLSIPEETASAILQLPESRWLAVQQESLSVLEQTMRKTIRDSQVQENKNNVPTLISFSFPEDQSNIVKSLVIPLIVPNSLFSEEETTTAREKAIDAVVPVVRTYADGQTIVLRGEILSQEQWEVLQLFGLIRPENNLKDIIATSALVLTLSGFILLYFSRRKISPIYDLRSLTVIAIGFLVFLYGARFIIPNRSIMPYFFPLPAYALVLVTLFNLEIGIIFSLVLSVLSAFGLPNSLDLTLFYLISSLIGSLALGKGRKISSFFWAGIAIGLAGSAILTAYRLNDPLTDAIGFITLIGATFLNGIASASLALLIQYFLSQVLGLATPLHLLEVSRHDHPLLKFLLQNAPGTYQHSLQVSNLAEQAAEAIGADGLLTRVGAIFHDAGKALNPTFFIENQVPGNIDAHHDMDPSEAARTIIQHIHDGVTLANKYRIPPRLKDFILEHHGDNITRYQYTQALERNGNDPEKVNIELFRYPGPKPQSKETALLMLADGCEARARAELPKNDDELKSLIKKVFTFCLDQGQLENTNLTLKDLIIAQESFYKTLSNTYHPRIQYPEIKTTSSSNSETKPSNKIS